MTDPVDPSKGPDPNRDKTSFPTGEHSQLDPDMLDAAEKWADSLPPPPRAPASVPPSGPPPDTGDPNRDRTSFPTGEEMQFDKDIRRAALGMPEPPPNAPAGDDPTLPDGPPPTEHVDLSPGMAEPGPDDLQFTPPSSSADLVITLPEGGEAVVPGPPTPVRMSVAGTPGADVGDLFNVPEAAPGEPSIPPGDLLPDLDTLPQYEAPKGPMPGSGEGSEQPGGSTQPQPGQGGAVNPAEPLREYIPLGRQRPDEDEDDVPPNRIFSEQARKAMRRRRLGIVGLVMILIAASFAGIVFVGLHLTPTAATATSAPTPAATTPSGPSATGGSTTGGTTSGGLTGPRVALNQISVPNPAQACKGTATLEFSWTISGITSDAAVVVNLTGPGVPSSITFTAQPDVKTVKDYGITGGGTWKDVVQSINGQPAQGQTTFMTSNSC